jgi:hypothetical protein
MLDFRLPQHLQQGRGNLQKNEKTMPEVEKLVNKSKLNQPEEF